VTTAFTLLESRSQLVPQAAAFAEWVQPDGGCAASFHRLRSGYLVRFPDLADFELSTDALSIDCYPAPRVSEGTCRTLYMNQVLPLALSSRGTLVLHASAVEMPSRNAAIFAGRSGSGKSTLAAAFAAAGCRFLSDDGSVVEEQGENCWTLPSHPSLRLWSDSESAIASPGSSPSTRGSAPAGLSKVRVEASDRMRFCRHPRLLSSIYFLGTADADSPRFERLPESLALIELVKNCFVLDPQERSVLEAQFDRLTRLVMKVPCFRLDYPRRFEALERLRRAIVEHCATWGKTA
jgi:hypothetical protein